MFPSRALSASSSVSVGMSAHTGNVSPLVVGRMQFVQRICSVNARYSVSLNAKPITQTLSNVLVLFPSSQNWSKESSRFFKQRATVQDVIMYGKRKNWLAWRVRITHIAAHEIRTCEHNH